MSCVDIRAMVRIPKVEGSCSVFFGPAASFFSGRFCFGWTPSPVLFGTPMTHLSRVSFFGLDAEAAALPAWRLRQSAVGDGAEGLPGAGAALRPGRGETSFGGGGRSHGGGGGLLT